MEAALGQTSSSRSLRKARHTGKTKQDAQVNARIDKRLKDRGDAAFARAGLTSSEAIRNLYEFAADHSDHLEEIRSLLGKENQEDRAALTAEKERRLKAFHEGIALARRFAEEYGLEHAHDSISTLPYKDLREAAYAERLKAGV